MKHITIGIFHDETLGSELGKKGTVSDILMFNRKNDDGVYTFMAPLEDKITTKTQIISIIDAAIISCEKITPEIGETILLLDSVGIKDGIIIVPQYSETSQLENLIKDSSLKNFTITEKNTSKIMDIIEKINPDRNISAPAVLLVDHSFSVKGVGEVILGIVKQGTIYKHDKMLFLPLNKEIIIRSIQMQDKDYAEAYAGCRVGLAIKNANAEEMKRGSVFTTKNEAKIDKKFTLDFRKNRFYPEIRKGLFHATIAMQSVPVNITDINENILTIEMDKPVCYTADDIFILLDLNAKKLHHMGNGTIKH
jgi:selenocysteine-specific translation elongation factor